MAAIFMTVLLHPTRAELITAALSRGCHKASEENVNQRLKHKQTKENAALQHCIATREREGGFCFPGSTLDHSGVQKREGREKKQKKDFYGVFHFSCVGVGWRVVSPHTLH